MFGGKSLIVKNTLITQFQIVMNKQLILLVFTFLITSQIIAQTGFIKTKEGRIILDKRQMIANCLKGLNKDKSDATALSICQCQVEKFDKHFTYKQFKSHEKNGIIDISALVEEDSALKKTIDDCYRNSGKTLLLQAEGFEKEFIADCIKNIQSNTEKTLSLEKLTNFCTCQLELVKTKQLTDAEMELLSNPNSVLFFEISYKCGNPFVDINNAAKNWNNDFAKDITGPDTDTIKVITLNGMTYIKVKIGNTLQVWLLDTGASDLLINKEMEAELLKEQVLTTNNYLGTGEYEMANGVIDTCRKYKVDNVKIGKFTVNNITLAVTDKGKRIIVGKALLNKFSNWVLNNKNEDLILSK